MSKQYGSHRASWALELAAQAWGTPETQDIQMDTRLAEAFAEIIERDTGPLEKDFNVRVAELEGEMEKLRDVICRVETQRNSIAAEVAELNRVLAAGREEHELAIAEMNRRGGEVKRLEWQRDYVIDIAEEYGGCDFTGPDVESLDDKYAACHEGRRQP